MWKEAASPEYSRSRWSWKAVIRAAAGKASWKTGSLWVRVLKVKELQMMTRSRCSPGGSRLMWRWGWWWSHCSICPGGWTGLGARLPHAQGLVLGGRDYSEGHSAVWTLLWTLIFWSLGINSFTWQIAIECLLGVKHCLCMAWWTPSWTRRSLCSGGFAPLGSWSPCGCYVRKDPRMMYVGKESKTSGCMCLCNWFTLLYAWN